MPAQTPSEDLIRYDVMVQEALVGVVRKVLSDAARNGLPGDHHFYISFRSQAPGVRLSSRLREKHPEEMTIVLQHQFWDLLVTEHALEVGLSFGGVPERLLVPFEAMTGFYDPSVQFGLKFAAEEAQADNDSAGEARADVRERLGAIAARERADKVKDKPRAPAKPSADQRGQSVRQEPANAETKKQPASGETAAKPRVARAKSGEKKPDAAAAASAEVVSLDSFRKKK